MAEDITAMIDSSELSFEVLNHRMADFRKSLNDKGLLTRKDDEELGDIIFQLNRNRVNLFDSLHSEARARKLIENYDRIHGGQSSDTQKP